MQTLGHVAVAYVVIAIHLNNHFVVVYNMSMLQPTYIFPADCT